MAIRHVAGRRLPWEASVSVNGKRSRKFFERKKDAVEFIRDVDLQKLGLSGIKRGYPLADAFASFQATDSAQKTKPSQDADRRIFDLALHFFVVHRDKKRISEIGLEDLQLLQLWLEKEQSLPMIKKEAWGVTTVELYCRTLKRFFKKMFDLEYLPKNPAQLWRVPRGATEKRRPMTVPEFQAIYSAAPAWFRPVLTFMRLTGARGASVATLTWADVDFDNRRLILKSRKGGVRQVKTIPLPLYPALFEMLQHEAKQLRGRSQPSRKTDPVFWGPRGASVTSHDIRAAGSRLIKRCGLEGVVLYGLRHAIAVDMTKAGVPLEVIRQTMGHSNLAQTSHYASGISLDVVDDAMKQVRDAPLAATADVEPPDLDGE